MFLIEFRFLSLLSVHATAGTQFQFLVYMTTFSTSSSNQRRTRGTWFVYTAHEKYFTLPTQLHNSQRMERKKFRKIVVYMLTLLQQWPAFTLNWGPTLPREGCLYIYIFEVQLSAAGVYRTVYCRVRWMQRTRSSEQSCNQRVLQLQAYYHHRWPRIDREEWQRRVKTGHDKRNQGDSIIRHNYVAVGPGRRRGQRDGWVGGSKVVNMREIQEINKMLC